jgi:predicted Zn-dependent protease
MLADEPDDSFLRYTLAMEMWKTDEQSESLAIFESLTGDKPPHVPAFLMMAQRQAEIGKVDEARETLRVGIEAARDQNNLHAASEMGELLSSLGESGL